MMDDGTKLPGRWTVSSLHKLFSPAKIGSMELRNRLVMAPMTTSYSGPGDTVSQRLIDYHVARAKGGVGLITFEVCTVDQRFPYQMHTVGLWGDQLIPSHVELTKAVHAHGAKIVPQISHPGPESASPFVNQTQPIGPSVVRSSQTGQTCREVTLEEIELIIEQYGEAARRAREAGYDGMELHCAHSYMMCGSFITPLRNKRTDAYTGSTVEGRLKFPIAVIKSMKAKAGKDFPLTLRISGDERQPGGRDIKGTLEIVPKLVEAGVDAFHVSGGVIDRLTTGIIAGSSYGPGINVPEAAAIKKVTNVPVMVVGRIHDPELAEQILQAGQADMIVMGRPLLGDPELPNKAARGELHRIRRCISCENCFDSCAEGDLTNMCCAVNALSGKEGQLSLEKAAKPKKVMVVGGGPAGMEATRVAAVRGHSVTLYEKQARLSGSLLFANTVHPDNDRLLNYLLDRAKVCKMVLTFEGEPEITACELEQARGIGTRLGAKDLGEGPARHWWEKRYKVSYAMSTAFDLGLFVDTIEVATLWENLEDLYSAIRKAIRPQAFVMAHFSHAYPQGCSIYFTFSAGGRTMANRIKRYDRIWEAALNACVELGGTITHHHGVGLLKAKWLEQEEGGAHPILQGLKQTLDPKGLMNPGKLGLSRLMPQA